ncbi:hypothetical protein BDV95DRAFT_605128 [Massariosphaeria phaeospora]|uniref:Uncharacterized protein n=1 Tax=Massariosphaeria phaeospora TaxID=100035 RepID=A0A7C8MCN5_9PLEO|nr:hypothetical protein BDV95DRAFT_605128 [Massariosphaeria phaeospora]
MCFSPLEVVDSFPADYYLICPDLAQFQTQAGHTCTNLATFFPEHSQHAPWLWSTFAKPLAGAQHGQIYLHGFSTANLSPLEQLPNEIIDYLIGLLSENKQDVLAMGLSSGVLWPVVLHHVHREYQLSTVSWAGHSVAFHGRNSTCMPPSFDKVRPAVTKLISTIDRYSYNPIFDPHTVYSRDHECSFKNAKSSEQDWLNVVDVSKHWTGLDAADWLDIEADISQSYMFPQDRVWVLRNVTEGQFIRSDKLIPSEYIDPTRRRLPESTTVTKVLGLFKNSHSYGKRHVTNDILPISFAQIVLILCCYTSNIPLVESPFAFHTGRWAGHRLDIVTLEEHLKESSIKSWKDVSEPIVNDVGNLRWWVAHLGGEFNAKNVNGHWDKVFKERDMFRTWKGDQCAPKPQQEKSSGLQFLKRKPRKDRTDCCP